jgi:aspartyl-tRNA(Asn)/glutamyl-tRNA(Gln) amidotransferase subunit B
LKLGTRTEIKNLSTIKSVEDAIIAERDRQIRELETGGTVLGETRGFSVGSTETRRLRGKEGEVDYRYMPDPDIKPLAIGSDLVEHLRTTLAVLPDAELDSLISEHGLTPKDASSLLNLDNGARVQYFYKVVDHLKELIGAAGSSSQQDLDRCSALVGNWTIHELGRLTTFKAGPMASGELTFSQEGECSQVPHIQLAQLLFHLQKKQITGKVAKELLLGIYLEELEQDVSATIADHDLWFKEISAEEYEALADEVLQGEEKVLKEFVRYTTFPQGKLMYLVGKFMRTGPTERIDPATAEAVLHNKVDQLREP